MNRVYFATALRNAVRATGMNQREFSKRVRLSVPLLGKIYRGEPIRSSTVSTILKFFQRLGKSRKELALLPRELAASYLRDVSNDLEEPLGRNFAHERERALLSRRDQSILFLFRQLETPLLLAFYSLGVAAKNDSAIRDSLLALADSANKGHRTFPPDFFRKKTNGRRFNLLGGSMGQIALDLCDEDDA